MDIPAIPEEPAEANLSLFPFLEALSSFSLYGLNGFILLLLLLCSALVSASEVALFSLNSSDIQSCRNSRKRCDQYLWRLLARPQRVLATILILNNVANITFVTLSTFLVWRIVGTQDLKGWIVTSLTAVVTFCIVFFGEIIPKVYASQNALRYARFISIPLYYTNTLLLPLTTVFGWIHHQLQQRIQKKGYKYSIDSLEQALDIATQGPHDAQEEARISKEEEGMLRGIMHLSSMPVKEVMQPRHTIKALSKEQDFYSLLSAVKPLCYSRIPIYCEALDKIEGILYSKDLLPYLSSPQDFAWHNLLRPAHFVPENQKIGALFKDFQKKRVHMAIVVDEYGGTSGLVTMEDVIEEIVGDIRDESDQKEKHYQKLAPLSYLFEAKVSINDLCKTLQLDTNFFGSVRNESQSLGGLILEINGNLPQVGTKIRYRGLLFTIASVHAKGIKKVSVLLSESLNKKSQRRTFSPSPTDN